MKKRLEAELISIAHRILKLKNKSEVDQLYIESKKLYETLTVLKFYGDNYEMIKSEISEDEMNEKLAFSFEQEVEKPIEVKNKKEKKQEIIQEVEVTKEEEISFENEIHEEEIVAQETPIIEETVEVETVFNQDESEENLNQVQVEDISFDAIFEMASEEIIEDKEVVDVKKEENLIEVQNDKQISFDDLLGENYTEPVFVKPNQVTKPAETAFEVALEEKQEQAHFNDNHKSIILNDKLAQGINIGLNDRVAFVKHLFADSSEDFNRVLSQLNTFDSLEDAKNFIDDMVKPDYNNWNSKEEYAERFMEIIEKKFN